MSASARSRKAILSDLGPAPPADHRASRPLGREIPRSRPSLASIRPRSPVRLCRALHSSRIP